MQRGNCPICNAARRVAIHHRKRTPVLLNRVHETQEAARAVACGELDLVMCENCGFAWNRAFDSQLTMYDEAYDNDQTSSPAFQAHVQAIAAKVVASVPSSYLFDYLEIGCGQGGFIREIARLIPRGALRSAQGFDPAWRGDNGTGPCGSHIYREYFQRSDQITSPNQPNIVVSRHTIEHVPDPMSFLGGIRRALGTSSRAQLFIETPCVDWIFAHQALQDLFYEHCSLFSTGALHHALECSGFEKVAVHHVFGGQYLWATAVAGTGREIAFESRSVVEASVFGRDVIPIWNERVSATRRKGPVAIWGAGAKGVTMAALLDDPDLLDCAIDINPAKQGRYLPGSGLKVVSPHSAVERRLATIFVMNSNYLEEIGRLARDVGLKAALLPIEE